MSEGIHHSGRCAVIADDLPLLALGTLDGRGRADVLRHVDRCQQCRTELEQLSLVAEMVQQLTPEVQPPLGFESRVAERFKEQAAARRRSRRRPMLGIAAAVILLAAGVGAVIIGSGDSSHRSASSPRSASLMAAGQEVGSVVITPGNPPWMLMTIQSGSWDGTVTCEVTLADGQVATVGTFTLSGAYPSWAVELPATGGDVVSARILDATGSVLASASLDA